MGYWQPDHYIMIYIGRFIFALYIFHKDKQSKNEKCISLVSMLSYAHLVDALVPSVCNYICLFQSDLTFILLPYYFIKGYHSISSNNKSFELSI